MMGASFAGLPRRSAVAAVGAGVVVGIVYALSPLTVWAMLAFAFLIWLIGADLPADERTRVRLILLVAILARLAVIGGAWLFTDHARVPFASFFGDEEYFIRRATWLRNVALGIPIHNADMIYAFDDYSYTHYLYVIAFIEAQTGRIRLDTLIPGRGPVVVETLGPGTVLGWSWLFPPFMWAFGAVAASPVESFEFDARTVRAWCASDPALGYEVTWRVAEVPRRPGLRGSEVLAGGASRAQEPDSVLERCAQSRRRHAQ
jgi:hypothetical protein